ncbi:MULTISPECIES: hypothetical protein [unclassified Streptomyces]|uniref:hypothetical protein n=1 Tax=unclassified Streptomyces TaxID=2593676 RepID=UPI0033215297
MLPQVPAGGGETNAHLVIRAVLEDLATSMLRDGVAESDRLMVLPDLDRLPVGMREEWGQLLLDMLDDVEQAPEGHVKWRSRRQLHEEADGDRQMLFVCGPQFDKYVEASFGSYVISVTIRSASAQGVRSRCAAWAYCWPPTTAARGLGTQRW